MPKVTEFLPSFSFFDHIDPDFTGFGLVLFHFKVDHLVFTELYLVYFLLRLDVPIFTEFYRVLPSFTEFYFLGVDLPSFTGFGPRYFSCQRD